MQQHASEAKASAHVFSTKPARKPLFAGYYLATFCAVAALQSIPRFTNELLEPLMLPQRAVLLIVFLGVTWFFTYAIHGEMSWSVLSTMFFTDTMITAVIAVLLLGQVLFPALAYATLGILIARALFYAYLVSSRLPHLRGFLFATTSALLIAGEFIITFGNVPF
jgi:hypothetical protein